MYVCQHVQVQLENIHHIRRLKNYQSRNMRTGEFKQQTEIAYIKEEKPSYRIIDRRLKIMIESHLMPVTQ